MKSLRIIQLASYRGNIGDNANVTGTRRLLNQNLGCEIQYTNLEYLEYEPDPLWGGKKFDNEFANLVNQHDLLLIGGGGFLELAVDDSISGTPINIPFEILDKIKVPIIFYALGFHVLQGADQNREDKFKKYLDYLLSSDKILVSLRNDGSFKTLHNIYGDKYSSRIHKCPDGGFFTFCEKKNHPEIVPGSVNIAIQLAADGIAHRFPDVTGNETVQQPSSLKGKLKQFLGAAPQPIIPQSSYSLFLERLSNVLITLFKKNSTWRVVFVPHIPEDFKMIMDIIPKIGPPYVRRNITVAPYVHGSEGHDYIFSLYSQCDISIGMRFHANVCSIAFEVPSIGLVTYEQIGDLYAELSIPERAIEVNNDAFGERLLTLIGTSLNEKTEIQKKYHSINQKLFGEINEFHVIIKQFLNLN